MSGKILLFLLSTIVLCSGEGNIHLLQEEIANALHSCILNTESKYNQNKSTIRHRRSNYYYNNPGMINNERNTSYKDQIHVLNGTNYDYNAFGAGDVGEKYFKTIPRPALGYNNNSFNNVYSYRRKRSKNFMGIEESEQCISQCVFANLQVVDLRGIPREAELWNKIQTSVNSQQSRAFLKDQLRACFQELQSESEDNGCSYSNKLERCMMLQLADRKIGNSTSKNSKRN